MKRIYIENLKIKKKLNYIESIKYEIISKKGLYKIINNELYLFKLPKNDTNIINEQNITFYITNYSWFKIKEKINILPFEHKLIKTNIKKYKINDNLILVIEGDKNVVFETKDAIKAIPAIILFLSGVSQ
jgi:hypothetical protein